MWNSDAICVNASIAKRIFVSGEFCMVRFPRKRQGHLVQNVERSA